jgi:hypothetical protein
MAPDGERPVGQLELALERPRGGVNRVLRAVEADEAPVRQRDENGLVFLGIGPRGRDRVPFPGARNAGDTRLDPAESARVVDFSAQVIRGSMSP